MLLFGNNTIVNFFYASGTNIRPKVKTGNRENKQKPKEARR
jgi:hypothetical protein